MNKYLKYSVLLGVTVFALQSPVFAQPASPTANEAKKFFMEGENLRKTGNNEGAIAKYDEAIAKDLTNYKYYFQRGKCEFQIKKFDNAKSSFKSAVQYKPDFTPAYALLAKIYKNEKDYENAVFYYSEAARNERDPRRQVEYKLLLVNILLKTDKVYDAKRHLAEAKQIDPTNPNILYYEAEINAQDGNWAQAKLGYEQAVESPALATASAASKAKYYYGLGTALMNIGDNAGAKAAWSKANFGPYKGLIAQQMLKTNHLYYYKIAVSYYLNNEFADAEQYLDKTLEIQRDFAGAYVLKAKMAAKRGNTPQAITFYKQALSFEQDPKKQAPMHVMVGNLQLNSGDAYGALASIENALKAGGANPNLLYLKARAEYESSRLNEAAGTLENLIASNPNADAKTKAKYNFLLGLTAKKLRDNVKADKAFRAALYGPYKPAAKAEVEKLAKGGK